MVFKSHLTSNSVQTKTGLKKWTDSLDSKMGITIQTDVKNIIKTAL